MKDILQSKLEQQKKLQKKKKEQLAKLLKHSTLLEYLTTRYKIVTILAASFAFLILFGTLLLSLPFSNRTAGTSILTHLFVATSAVCVTGLSPITVAEQYTLFGKIIMILLMQVGGLGLMTFVSMALTLGRNKFSFKELTAFADAAGKHGYYDVSGYLKRILLYTFTFEFLGLIALAIRFTADFGMKQGLFNALFISVAAFTNAGFDCFASDSLARYATDPLVSITVMLLIIVGGLGFMVWIELRHHYQDMKKKRLPLRSVFSSFSVHTKVVCTITFWLIVSGTLLFLLCEWNNPLTLGTHSIPDKSLIAAFQSVTLRTAGFATISMAACRRVTRMIMCLFMIIGGSPGGTAGGIKTTTFLVIIVMLRSFFKNEPDNCNLFHRRIRRTDFVSAELILTIYMIFLFIGVALLSVTEPEIPVLDLTFEGVSAIATVGLSADVTSSLSILGRVIIIVMMFTGRIGPLAMIEIFERKSTAPPHEHVHYPHADILIG